MIRSGVQLRAVAAHMCHARTMEFQFGRYQAQFRFEAFNAFNWVNLGLPDATIFTSRGVRNPTAGRIRSTSTPARQIQLGFKFLF